LENKNVIVTGATGFIGKNLITRLQNIGCNVHIIARSNSNLSGLNANIKFHIYNGDIGDLIKILDIVKPYLIYHLAAKFVSKHKSTDIDDLIKSNILFPTQLLEAMSLTGINKIINIGTLWQHFNNQKYNPVNLYASTKQSFEDIAKYYCNSNKMDFISLHIPDTYGPNDTRPKLFQILKEANIHDNNLKMSPGLQQIDLIYIDDIIDAIIHTTSLFDFSKNKNFRFYTLTSNKYHTLKQVVDLYLNLSNSKLQIQWGGLPYRDREIMKIKFSLKYKLPNC